MTIAALDSAATKLDQFGKPAWIALIVLGFMAWWPIGLCVLAFTIGVSLLTGLVAAFLSLSLLFSLFSLCPLLSFLSSPASIRIFSTRVSKRPRQGIPPSSLKKNQSIHSFLFRFFSAERIACHVLRISHYVLLMTFDFQPLTPPLLIPFDSPWQVLPDRKVIL